VDFQYKKMTRHRVPSESRNQDQRRQDDPRGLIKKPRLKPQSSSVFPFWLKVVTVCCLIPIITYYVYQGIHFLGDLYKSNPQKTAHFVRKTFKTFVFLTNFAKVLEGLFWKFEFLHTVGEFYYFVLCSYPKKAHFVRENKNIHFEFREKSNFWREFFFWNFQFF
jgi:hypothetical protein